MMMGIDKARADDLVGTIDDFSSIWRVDILRNLDNLAILNQNATNGRLDVMVVTVNEECAILKKNDAILGHDCRRCFAGGTRCRLL